MQDRGLILVFGHRSLGLQGDNDQYQAQAVHVQYMGWSELATTAQRQQTSLEVGSVTYQGISGLSELGSPLTIRDGPENKTRACRSGETRTASGAS